jgi:two-component system KDP operon response regulator KdpE
MESDERGPATAGARVLVVEDEPHIRDLIALHLGLEGLTPVAVGDGNEGLRLARAEPFDLVVLDLMLPGLDGVTVCRAIRRDPTNSDVPILMLTARREESDKVLGLESGADDYLTKPFGMDELFARLRAALRRAVVPEGHPVVTAPDFVIDFGAKQVQRRDEVVRLTPTQWHIVEVLVRNAGRLVTPAQLLLEVWGPSYGTETNYLRVFMTHIRRLLEPQPSAPRYFVTEPGLGYRFELPRPADPGSEV